MALRHGQESPGNAAAGRSRAAIPAARGSGAGDAGPVFSYLGEDTAVIKDPRTQGKGRDSGDLATRDHAEKAVLKILARHA